MFLAGNCGQLKPGIGSARFGGPLSSTKAEDLLGGTPVTVWPLRGDPRDPRAPLGQRGPPDQQGLPVPLDPRGRLRRQEVGQR